MEQTYDRSTQDVGNILGMEHVNVTVPDQYKAMLFYVNGLGFTRDPYMMVGPENMWINVGEQQFHLPTSEPQVLRGHVGLVVPDIEALKARLVALREPLAGSSFTCAADNGHVNVTCPWGNQFRCYAPGPQFGDMTLGIPYIEFDVPPGTAAGIGQFYKDVFCAPYSLSVDMTGAVVCVQAGLQQKLLFRETPGAQAHYDGHHFAVYVANFSGPHRFLKDRGLITQESSNEQYRFQDIINPESGRVLFTIEHEVRSLRHPMYGRSFVNRNPSQNIRTYARGQDAFVAA